MKIGQVVVEKETPKQVGQLINPRSDIYVDNHQHQIQIVRIPFE